MSLNSPKPSETGLRKIIQIETLREWLDREGGHQKIPLVIDLLAEQTAKVWTIDQASPSMDIDSLRKIYIDKQAGVLPNSSPSHWLPTSDVERWWESRRTHLVNYFHRAGLTNMPELVIQRGGGRGNPTLYRLDLVPLPPEDEVQLDTPPSENEKAENLFIRYHVQPAKASFWLHPLVGTKPFRMRSWRGYLLILMMLAPVLILTSLWGLVLLNFVDNRPVQRLDVGLILVSGALTWGWWSIFQPLIRLPTDRITSASEIFLGWSQHDGQFRLTRDAESKLLGRWFQLSRHWGTCPICSGEVDIANGRDEFKGRLIGRCGDSPTEHVFSFDPIRLTGKKLRGL